LAVYRTSDDNLGTTSSQARFLLLIVPAQSMNVSGEFTVKAPRNAVFDALRDARSFVRFVDGVQDLKEIDSTHYEAVFETKVVYLVESTIAGKLGSIGQPVLRAKTREMEKIFAARLREAFAEKVG
jgi:carbon monoxide dehydrogenase subunit G